MFVNYSLCPGGAMMLCESVAEYDPNGRLINSPEVNNQITSDLNQIFSKPDYSYVEHMREKLRPYYAMTKGLEQAPMNPTLREEAIAFVRRIDSTAGNLADDLRLMLVKASAIYNYFSENDSAILYDSLRPYMGMILNNHGKLVEYGLDKYRITLTHASLLDHYDFWAAIRVYFKATEDKLPEFPFELSKVYNVMDAYQQGGFSSTQELIDAFFGDYERFARTLNVDGSYVDDREIIRRAGNRYGSDPRCESESVTVAIEGLSKRLRQVKIGCYDLLNDLIDGGDAAPEDISSRIQPLLAGTCDIFYISTLALLCYTYMVANLMSIQSATKIYTEQIKDVLLPKPPTPVPAEEDKADEGRILTHDDLRRAATEAPVEKPGEEEVAVVPQPAPDAENLNEE